MTTSTGSQRGWRLAAASSVALLLAAAVAAAGKPKSRPAPAGVAPAPVVGVVGLSVIGPGLGAKDDEVRPAGMPGTELTLAVTIAPPAGILAISGEAGTLEIRGAGGPLEHPEFGFGSEEVADDGRGGTITARSNGLPGAGTTAVSASGTLTVTLSAEARTEKVAGIKWNAGATFRLVGSLISVTKADIVGDALRVEIKGPAASVSAMKAVRFRPGTGAAVGGEGRGKGWGGEEAWRSYSFPTKEVSGSLEVDLWRDPQDVVVPFRVSTGMGLAPPPAGAAVVARPALTPLAPGTASGRLVVDGKALDLAHAAAVSGPCEFDKTRESYAVFLTEKPLPPGALENASTLKEAEEADQVKAGLVMTMCPEEPLQTYQLFIRHPVGNLRRLESLTRQERWRPLGPERVSGLVKSFHHDRPDDIQGHQAQYRVRFNAPVRKRFPVEAPLVLAAGAVKVGAGGGEPGRAYLAQQCGPLPVNPEDPKSVEAFLAKEGKLPTDADLADLAKEAGKPVTREEALTMLGAVLALANAFRPKDCKVLGGAQDGTLAVLQVEATVMDDRSLADVYLVKEGGGWKYKKHGTWRTAKAK